MTYYPQEIILVKILKRAIKDYSSDKYMRIKEQREEIILFFRSNLFHEILNTLDIDDLSFFKLLEKREKRFPKRNN